ncbi:MAG: Trm112 family protein [Phycisphaerae bacterium]|nr:Trm112 family protein [Phycisphaerae bacterium]MDW8261041.1 hypothetical protein [Phycisphaerales bacterium]
MSSEPVHPQAFDPSFASLLRCPVTRSRVRMDGDWLICEAGGLAYPIRDGIPVMLPESARLPEGFSSLEEFKRAFAQR